MEWWDYIGALHFISFHFILLLDMDYGGVPDAGCNAVVSVFFLFLKLNPRIVPSSLLNIYILEWIVMRMSQQIGINVLRVLL